MVLLWFYLVAAILVAAWNFPLLLALHTEVSGIEESMACCFQYRIKLFHESYFFFSFIHFKKLYSVIQISCFCILSIQLRMLRSQDCVIAKMCCLATEGEI